MSTIAAQIGDLYARKLMTAQLRLDEIAKRINDMAVNVNSYADAIVTYEKWIDTTLSDGSPISLASYWTVEVKKTTVDANGKVTSTSVGNYYYGLVYESYKTLFLYDGTKLSSVLDTYITSDYWANRISTAISIGAFQRLADPNLWALPCTDRGRGSYCTNLMKTDISPTPFTWSSGTRMRWRDLYTQQESERTNPNMKASNSYLRYVHTQEILKLNDIEGYYTTMLIRAISNALKKTYRINSILFTNKAVKQ